MMGQESDIQTMREMHTTVWPKNVKGEVRFQYPAAVSANMIVFWVVPPCGLVELSDVSKCVHVIVF
jgi:hypothetical protein